MFVKRLISAIVLIGILAAVLFSGSLFAWGFVAIVAIAANWELNRALKIFPEDKKVNAPVLAGMIIIAVMCVLMHYFDFALCAIMGTVLYLNILLGVLVFKHDKYSSQSIAIMIFAFVYAGIFPTFIGAIRDKFEAGAYLTWLVLIIPVASDTFAYLIGSKFGKHKLMPKVSPKKSIEGSVAGIVAAVVLTGLYACFMARHIAAREGFAAACMLLALICAPLSQIGDLAASAIKREQGIKDYSNLIPGHGGALDRIDAIIFIAPIAYAGILIIDKMFLH